MHTGHTRTRTSLIYSAQRPSGQIAIGTQNYNYTTTTRRSLEMAEVEGFICPLCKQDLHSFQHLDAHFREEHSETAGSRFKSNFKSFLDKAKTSLAKKPQFQISFKNQLSVDEGASAAAAGSGREQGPALVEAHVCNVSGIDAEAWPVQEMGFTVNHMMTFKRHRDAYLSNTVVETNRLVVRLEKLFRKLKEETPKTSKQMKSLEQEVVPWKKDDDEKNCRECNRKFGVQRRKHHCRLCGYIICKQCSHFMTLGQSYPLLGDCPDYSDLAPSPSLKKRRLKIEQGLGKKKTSKKDEADDVVNDDAATDEVRMCSTCERLVGRRLRQLEGQETTILEAIYKKMQLVMEEASRHQPLYQEMVDSLLGGDHRFTLFDAQKKRHELVRLYEQVDSISKDILSLGEVETSIRDQKLGQNIRRFASTYLQENMLALPALPTNVQLREIRERREREALERVKEIERQRELKRQKEALNAAGVAMVTRHLEQEEKSGFDRFIDFSKTKIASSKLNVSFRKDAPSVEVDPAGVQQSGWIASKEIEIVDTGADPFQLQKQQLMAYIKQARAANRMDEVDALEQSLRDIELAIHQQEPKTYGFPN